MRSGLYEKLISEKLIIPHEEIDKNKFKHDENCYKILKPSKVKIISYPYEWSFSQLKDAAIATLKIQKIALK
ncbi:MAG: SAM-dependent methyltransferase, partial [Candidatus Thorarchaeota archaeon]